MVQGPICSVADSHASKSYQPQFAPTLSSVDVERQGRQLTEHCIDGLSGYMDRSVQCVPFSVELALHPSYTFLKVTGVENTDTVELDRTTPLKATNKGEICRHGTREN